MTLRTLPHVVKLSVWGKCSWACITHNCECGFNDLTLCCLLLKLLSFYSIGLQLEQNTVASTVKSHLLIFPLHPKNNTNIEIFFCLPFFPRYRSILQLVKPWYDEVNDYSFPYPRDCNPRCPLKCAGPMCTHYTQVRHHKLCMTVYE